VGQTVYLTATLLDANGVPLSGRPISWASSAPAVAGVSSGFVTGIAPGTVTITATSGGQSATAAITVGGGGGAGPWVEENFASYTSTTQLVTNPNPFAWIQGGYALQTDHIVLDQSVGYAAGGLTQSMRYDFPAFASRTPQYDYSIHLGAFHFPGVITVGQELWVECVVRFDRNFNTNSGGTGGIDYKFILMGYTSGTNRTEVKSGTMSGSGRDFSTNTPGNIADTWLFTVPDFGGNNTGVWDGAWHTYRIYQKVASSATVADGIWRVWVDGVLSMNQLAAPYTLTAYDILMPGANNNQGPTVAASVWWGRIRAWNTNPGW
jgi:hypothetical protein